MLFGQHGQERFDLSRAHDARLSHGPVSPVPADEKAHPMQVGFFGLKAVVQIPDALLNLIEKTVERKTGVPGFMAAFYL